jgi:hypothetical protein
MIDTRTKIWSFFIQNIKKNLSINTWQLIKKLKNPICIIYKHVNIDVIVEKDVNQIVKFITHNLNVLLNFVKLQFIYIYNYEIRWRYCFW